MNEGYQLKNKDFGKEIEKQEEQKLQQTLKPRDERDSKFRLWLFYASA